MKIRSLVVLFLALGLWVYPQKATSAQDSWEPVAPGIDYQEYTLPDPNRVYVARLDRAQENAIIDSGLAYGELGGGLEFTSDIAERYDQAINYWGGEAWGARNHVAVAINGSYIDRTGLPQSGQILSGWYAKRFDDNGGGSGFAWKMDRTPFVGGCVAHLPEKQTLRVITSGKTQVIAGVNILREPEGLFLYTPQWGASTGTKDLGVEVLVEVSRPTMVFPGPNVSIQGFVREIRDLQGSTPIPFDHVVLSARGAARDRLLKLVQVGDEVGINQEITHYERNCKTRHSQSWTNAYASVSGDFVFLENGEIRSYPENAGAINRHPRTAIVYNDHFIYFIVVDGRQPDVSIGMTIDELALFARDRLQATWGIALDGGGSSTMWVNGAVRNTPSVQCNRVYLPVAGQGNTGQGEAANPPPKEDPRPPTHCERPVVNSMMMIVVEPKVQSKAFQPGEKVLTLFDAGLRLGPGTNYATLADISKGMEGTIVPHPNKLEGVLAKGSYWWKVAFGGVVGWYPQEALGRPVRTFFDWLNPR
jgi:hypothetical protein